MTLENYNIIYDVLINSKNENLKLPQINSNFTFLIDIISNNIVVEINYNKTKIYLAYKCISDFFKDLEKFDEHYNNEISAFLYLKGVTKETHNEELFN